MLIVFEGIDGSGKGTQAKMLQDFLECADVRTALISFPRYTETFFGKEVGAYLRGEYGQMDQVHPFLAALLFAGDQLQSKTYLWEMMGQKSVVILDRYVASNIAHQAGKYQVGAQQDDLMRKLETLGFEIHNMPRPDLTILLDMSASLAQERIADKQARTYTTQKADLHEIDKDYLVRVADIYRRLADDVTWETVSCEFDSNHAKPKELIHREVCREVLGTAFATLDTLAERLEAVV